MTEVVFENFEDMTSLEPGQYCRPTSKNFKSVDSFSVLKAKLFDARAKDDDYVLVGFQVTVSPNHPVNGTGLKRVADRVNQIVQLPVSHSGKAKTVKLPLFLVFVGESNVLTTVQRINKDGGEAFKDVSFIQAQFSLILDGGFGELIRLTKLWEAVV